MKMNIGRRAAPQSDETVVYLRPSSYRIDTINAAQRLPSKPNKNQNPNVFSPAYLLISTYMSVLVHT